MPLFEVATDGLIPFRRLAGGAEIYESEIEELLWGNIEDFTGEPLLPIARQPTIGTGGRPDAIALDKNARVVVIEVKRDVDRGQLAQCLEYAGWARTTNPDELAGLYYRGPSAFFEDWQTFTDSSTPVVINRSPRLVLVARDFHGRTQSAVEFLIENHLPVKVIPVTVYEDQHHQRRLVDIEGEREADAQVETGTTTEPAADHTMIEGRRVRTADLLENGLIQPDEQLVWVRPRRGEEFHAKVLENGSIELPDGRVFSSPSLAAIKAADIPAYDGWCVPRLPEDPTLHDLRLELAHRRAADTSE